MKALAGHGLPWLKVLVLALVVYGLGLHSWFVAPMHSLGEERAALQSADSQMRVELRREPELRQRQQAAGAEAGMQAWSGLDAGAMNARIGQRLETWLVAVRPRCESIARTPIPVSLQGNIERHALRIRLNCSLRGLTELLALAESEAITLRVEDMEVASRRGQAVAGAAASGLDVQLDVAVYALSVRRAP